MGACSSLGSVILSHFLTCRMKGALNLGVSQGIGGELECWNHGEKITETTCVEVKGRGWTLINDSNTRPRAGQARTGDANSSNNLCSAGDAQSNSQVLDLGSRLGSQAREEADRTQGGLILSWQSPPLHFDCRICPLKHR